MIDAKQILGVLLQDGGMTKSSNNRVEHALGDKGVGSAGSLLGSLLGGNSEERGDGMLGSLKNLAGSLLGRSSGGGSNPLLTGGIGALAGALLGGGGKSVKGAAGGGALALLGSLALQALLNSGQDRSDGQLDTKAQLVAGLREPENETEEEEVQSVATMTLKSMINAAKADGHIDPEEMKRIVGKIEEGGATNEEQRFVMAEMQKPLDIDEIVREVPNPQVAAQVYAASLLAIELDTDAERRYLRELAQGLDLNEMVVAQLHGALGVA
jgi:uncharacterized membrane protein YebE (DUF533 family)